MDHNNHQVATIGLVKTALYQPMHCWSGADKLFATTALEFQIHAKIFLHIFAWQEARFYQII